MNEKELLLSGKATFHVEVPYRLYRTGNAASQPLYVYLHENGLNLVRLEEKANPLLDLPGYHLLFQAPYAEIAPVEGERGYHWIPESDDDATVTSAREHVSEFMQEVIDGLLPHIQGNRLVLVGWERSRRQVSYFCATRPHYVNELILFEGSMDQSWMEEDRKRYRHLRVLGLSGKDAEINKNTVNTISRWIESN
ncbi:hypothetical protein QA596_03055 [Balneolales bacterium ANBcel1]|nr:hypothetical protein [Balneolales bacterium ANBcel1]